MSSSKMWSIRNTFLSMTGVALIALGGANAGGRTDSAKIKDAVDYLVKNGALRLDMDQRKAWIDPALWLSLNAENKEKTTVVIATFVSPQNPMVTLYDKQSARELASYGSFQGFRVK